MEIVDNKVLGELLKKAEESPRKRMNADMRTSASDTSQRMLNALLPGTEVPIHRHADSAESMMCLMGRLDSILYDEEYNEIARYHICPKEGVHGCQIPKGVLHTVEVLEPSVIFSSIDGAYKG